MLSEAHTDHRGQQQGLHLSEHRGLNREKVTSAMSNKGHRRGVSELITGEGTT